MSASSKTSILYSFLRPACLLLTMLAAGTSFSQTLYESETSKWASYEDVAGWLKSNFRFDHERLSQAQSKLKEAGPENLPTRKAANLYSAKTGYCRDAASFARDALNRINPQYNARYIFIQNKLGQPNHWVTGFTADGKLYVMDYGAGPHWQAMKGVHGPYDSLEGYRDFLSSLPIKGFAVEDVKWRDIKGVED